MENLKTSTQDIDINTNISTWALPKSAIARFGKGTVNDALAFSPDGKYLVVGTWIGVWWYDAYTLSPIALWETERGVTSALAISPNGKQLSTGNLDGTVKIWNVQRGTLDTRIERPRQRFSSGSFEIGITQIAFSNNNQYIAASCMRNSVVHLWHADTGEQIVKLSTDPKITLIKRRSVRRPLCFSSDGQLLAHASPVDADGAADFISVWDMKTFEPIASIRDYTTRIDTLAFSTCGEYLAIGDASGTLKEWDIVSKKPTGKQIKTSSDYPQCYQIIPSYTISGQLRAACGSGSKIAVWNVEDGEKIDEFDYGWYIFSYHFLNGTHFAVQNPLKVWIENSSDRAILGHRDIGSSPVFAPSGKVLVTIGHSSGSGYCWDILEKRERYRVYDSEKKISQIYFSTGGSMYAHGTVRNTNRGIVWNVETDEIITTFFKPDTHLTVSDFSPTGGYCVFGDLKGNCYVFGGEEQPKILSKHTGAIEAIAFSSNGEQLASTSENGAAYVWDIASGQQIASLSTAREVDKNLYTGDAEQLQRKLKTLKNVPTKPKPHKVMAIVFSPCGDVIAGGMSREIRLWDATTHEIRLVILPPRTCLRPYALAFTPCGRYLASGSWWCGTDKVSIRLWDVVSGENIKTLWSHSTDIHYLTFSSDSKFLASGSYDGTILLWDMKPYLRNT